jgi:hypothetical protein
MTTPPPVDGNEVLREICAQERLKVADVIGPRKYDHLVEVRLKVARRLREHGWSTPRIGKLLRRDHSTIVSMLNGGKHRKPMLAPAQREPGKDPSPWPTSPPT